MYFQKYVKLHVTNYDILQFNYSTMNGIHPFHLVISKPISSFLNQRLVRKAKFFSLIMQLGYLQQRILLLD